MGIWVEYMLARVIELVYAICQARRTNAPGLGMKSEG